MNEIQQFSSAPQAVGTRKKYREPDDRTMTQKGNMMQDRRVVRGNTYAALVAPQPDMAEVQKQREAQRRRLMRASQKERRATTPEPVEGRKHMDIQTDSYLEELTERTVEFEAETQTDFLLDRPPSPLFMPAKIGVDIETQIEEGELFDFDVEVEPVLEVLVGKTLEQSMMEVLEEEELESLRRHQEDFEKRRNAELQEVQRMEAAEKRRSDEMARRVQQQAAQKEQDLSKMRKVVSRSVAAAHLSSLKDRALKHLLDAGAFADSTEMGLESVFMPNLLKMATKQLGIITQNQSLLDGVVQQAVQESLEKHSAKLDIERKRLADIDQAEREDRQRKAEEAAAKKAEEERLARLAAMPPPPPEEFQVTELDAETQLAVVDKPPGQAKIPEGKFEELQEMLAALTEGQKLVATLVRADGTTILQKVVEEAPAPAEGEDAEGEDGGEPGAGAVEAEGDAAPAAEGDAAPGAEGDAALADDVPQEEELPTLGEVQVVDPPPPEGEPGADAADEEGEPGADAAEEE